MTDAKLEVVREGSCQFNERQDEPNGAGAADHGPWPPVVTTYPGHVGLTDSDDDVENHDGCPPA